RTLLPNLLFSSTVLLTHMSSVSCLPKSQQKDKVTATVDERLFEILMLQRINTLESVRNANKYFLIVESVCEDESSIFLLLSVVNKFQPTEESHTKLRRTEDMAFPQTLVCE